MTPDAPGSGQPSAPRVLCERCGRPAQHGDLLPLLRPIPATMSYAEWRRLGPQVEWLCEHDFWQAAHEPARQANDEDRS